MHGVVVGAGGEQGRAQLGGGLVLAGLFFGLAVVFFLLLTGLAALADQVGEESSTVVVSRDVPAGRVALRLTAEQAAALDLAEGQEYEITGIVTDADGEALTFPSTVAHTIPARWLRPPGEQLELHPDTDRFHRALVCRDADGMTPAEIDRAAEKALEQLHHVQGMALEDPNVDHSVLTSEADHREWLRIAERVRTAGLAAYDPRVDPDAVEHPPLIRFGRT
ncbi:hypothetical protein ACFC1R_37625 [Kitasatospora sp. NPDC056138]|uniref:hypothetical protein n=1 Tax=Kitasatospora sp. NPDC056138 TaxID=3345724 RepID=UPI0035D848A1